MEAGERTSEATAPLDTRLPRPPTWAARAFDAVVVVGLTITAFVMRRGGLPVNGLWFDDSWVAAGALHGKITQIMTDGSGQPGFTALLMAWHAVDGGSSRSLAVPALVMGAITPAVLYLAFRFFGFRRSICALLASVVVVAGVDILYSGRVKPYTFDPVLVIGIGVAIPWLARRTWRWPLAVGWVVLALVLGSFSGYVLLATAAAGIVLFLHPAGDRLVRGCAVAVQAVGQLVFYEWAQRSTDLTGIENVLRDSYDAHLRFYANPFRFGSEILTHLGRIAWIYPGGSGAWLKVLGLLAVAGLIAASLKSARREELLPARYLLLMLAMAFVGALVGKFPFGPTVQNYLSSGGRYMLWSLPAMAFGLAAVLERVRDQARRHDLLARGFDAAVLVVAVVVLVAGYRSPVDYPAPGSASATRFVVDHLEPSDVVLIPGTSVFAFADAAHLPVTLRPTPTRQVGFTPHFANPRIRSFGYWGDTPQTVDEIRQTVGNAPRVFVVTGGGVFGPGASKPLTDFLKSEGYAPRTFTFDSNAVTVWRR